MPLDYLTGAARRADAQDGLDIVTLSDGTSALLARENDIDWLYFCRDGYLYKQNSAKNVATPNGCARPVRCGCALSAA